ncbi:MAG: 16S rRNA (cytosine(1402)-N(4))-methyltransferase RsmH [Proteobacteria bacterium]|jgi:16S rRNA (cytosine1402-N4)-methyltransferase|nr:16S rRNA (cytosine(1402)-N(4))-methyltransferase RsmH [Candidatus Fonsibacter sp. PEL5]
MSLEFKHIPVMSEDIDKILAPYKSGIYIDCTFGGGGITRKILSKKNTQVISIDRDNFVEFFSTEIKKEYKERFEFIIDKFSNLENILKERNLQKIPVAIIFDLGLSSFQIDNPERGFSYRQDGLLKMTMGKNNVTAHDIVNKLDQKDLRNIFSLFGEDKDSGLIAKLIVQKRKDKEINSTQELAEIILRAKRYKNSKYNKVDSCAKIFQAIRMIVNQELSELYEGLISAIKNLSIDGKIVVITFHSLEDKVVKKIFDIFSNKIIGTSRYLPEGNVSKNFNILEIKNRRPIIASEKETKNNNRARSAKLRCATKIQDHSFEFKRSYLNLEKYFQLEEVLHA